MSDDLLLWIDLETTGTDVEKDSIIEVGWIVTDPDLTVIDKASQVVRPTALGLGRMLQNAFVSDMHNANGLLDLVLNDDDLHSIGRVDLDMAADLDGVWQGKFILAGSGVGHFDRRFIDRWMPKVASRLRYYCLDIGVIRRAHRMWLGSDLSTAYESKTHRALDDIECHLEEARAFRNHWQSLSTALLAAGDPCPECQAELEWDEGERMVFCPVAYEHG